MWRLMGSSPERVRIADMGDVVYYRQVKDYSDQDYEASKDLQRAVQRGAITIMEHSNAPKSISGTHSPTYTTVNNSSAPPIDMEAIKQAVREAMPENKSKSISDALRDVIPSIVDMVRQEISSAFTSMRPASLESKPASSEFTGPEYVPTVTTEGMVSNINIEAKATSGEGVSSNLDLLRKLKQSQSK